MIKSFGNAISFTLRFLWERVGKISFHNLSTIPDHPKGDEKEEI